MKVKRLKLKNFRGYKDEIIIDFDDLTAFVGKNDIGKSTLLEALDIFFNNGNGAVKFDLSDINVSSKNECATISVVFSEIPDAVVIDDSVTTNLRDEYLLNTDGDFEVVKEYKNVTAAGQKVYIRASHPTNPNCSDLLSCKNDKLRKIIEENDIDCDDRRANSSMRRAIWGYYQNDLNCQQVELDVASKDGDIKSIWSKLQDYLPVYSLFQADRKNCDGDDEVQEPLKAAVKSILKQEDIQTKLSQVAEQVRNTIQSVANGTLEKIREMNPDLASSLHPKIPDVSSLKWNDVFKSISMTGDDEIPINKRGSGVKRLILLNFFRAEAEKKVEGSNSNVIYAIEEPETSQHYEHQNMLIKALIQLSETSNAQVVITTHSGNIVKHLNESQIRLISKTDNNRTVSCVTRHYLPYVSINEVNYISFNQISEEYHDELYGYLQTIAINEDENNSKENNFDTWLFQKGLLRCKTWIKEYGGRQVPMQCTLQLYIRNAIHHPENHLNNRFSEQELSASISGLINVCRQINP